MIGALDKESMTSSIKRPTPEERQELIKVFLACQQFRIQDVRKLVCESLPSEVKEAINPSKTVENDITNIVTACFENLYPESVEKLVNALFDYEERNEWTNLRKIWSRIRPPQCPSMSPPDKIPVISETYSRVGEDICINRRWECTTFDHMRVRDQTIPQHILAFQVQGGKGKTRLLNRFYYVCQVDASEGKPILYAKVDFRDRSLTADSLVSEILGIFIINAEETIQKLSSSAKISAGQVNQLKEAYEKIISQLNELDEEVENFTREQTQSKMSQRQQMKLARVFSAFCHLISDRWTVVLLLDTWEDAGMAGDWFIRHCIHQLVNLDNVIAVLAGRQGLIALESRPDEVIFRANLEPMKYRDDCQRWAELKYGLKISEEEAEGIIKPYDGDLQQIDMCLKVIKDAQDSPYLAALMKSMIPGG